MKQLLLVLLLTLPFTAFSQPNIIELKTYPETGIRTNFFLLPMLDARQNNADIGFVVQDGEFLDAQLNQPFPAAVDEALDKITNPGKNAKDSILLVFREFYITELKNLNGEYGRFHGLVDCYQQKNGLYYWAATKDLYEDGNQSNITAYQDDMILFELVKMVNQLNELFSKKTPATAPTGWTLEELANHAKHQEPANAIVPKKGMYRSITELRQNKPGVQNIDIQWDKGETYIVRHKDILLRDSSGTEIDLRKKNSTWAISDGQNVYLNMYPLTGETAYSRLQLGGEYVPFYSENTVEPIKGMSATAIGGAAGGLIGAAIGAAIDSGKKDNLEQTGMLVLNLSTGRVRDLTLERMNEILGPFPELLKEYQADPKKENAVVKAAYLERCR